ncbi:type II secretion system protein N [Pseudomonas sp. NPDC090755]|uniref:type II secretion system protein N n=1 Tax=Pseudomonas sp. NPDC090755 TaxID=3364481 RepID=UPI00383BC49B
MRPLPVLMRLPLRHPLLVLGIAMLCAWLGWLGQNSWKYQQALSMQPQPPAEPTPRAGVGHSPLDSQAIAELFGAIPPTPLEAGQGAMALTLLASLSESQALESRALIQSPQGAAFYRIGERLPGGALLKAVYVDHVLIQRGGREHSLQFPQHQNRLLATAQRSQPQSTRQNLQAGRRAHSSQAETTP